MTTPNHLKSYFAQKASALGVDFVYGGSERILDRQSSDLKYPCLWLEVPDIQVFRDGGLKKRFRTAFLFLENREADNYEGQDGSLDAMWVLTETLLRTIQQDAENGPLDADFDMARTESQHKPKFSADDDWGWRTEITLTVGGCELPECCD